MLYKSIFYLILLTTALFSQTVTHDFEDENLSGWFFNANWAIDEDKSSTILSLLEENGDTAFNLCYRSDVNFTDGNISVLFRANKGKVDQGGGLMWRVQDEENYYVARFNPLEDNFRFYVVENGNRKELSSVDVKLTGGWHTMKITQKGEHVEGYLDGKKLLDTMDARLSLGGGVGVWTKADARSSFDDLVIEIRE